MSVTMVPKRTANKIPAMPAARGVFSAPGVISMAMMLLVIGYPKSVVEIWSDLHVRTRGLALVRPAIVHGEQA
jgi:hypothetical protein